MDSKARFLSLTWRAIFNYFFKRPLCVSFEITHNCNARCKHCHLGGSKKEDRATPERFGEICRELKPFFVQVSGGEPLMSADLDEIIRALRVPNRSPIIAITTNGALLTKQRYLQLRQAGVDEFSVSFDYPDERHDEFRRIPGLFGRIKTLIESFGPEEEKAITLSCVVQSDNLRELVRMAEMAKGWGVRINYSCYTPLRTKDQSYMIPRERLPELKEILNELVQFKKRHDTIYTSEYVFKRMFDFFEKGSIPHCRAGDRLMVVNPNGTFSPCGLILTDYGSLEELKKDFMRTNECVYCYTTSRGHSERPAWHLVKDNIRWI